MFSKSIINILIVLISFVCINACNGACENINLEGRVEITDMANRKVMVPENILRVFCADMTCTQFMYALAPEKLIARNQVPSENEAAYTTEEFQKLPAVGFIMPGRTTNVNFEELAGLKPDIVLCPLFKHTTSNYIKDYEDFGRRIGATIIMVNLDLENLANSFNFIGGLLNKSEEAGLLANYCKNTFVWADSIKSIIKLPKRVYIAEGRSGLNTIPGGSTHSQVISVASAKNCAGIDDAYGYKDLLINMEQILEWNPDYIIVNNRSNKDLQSGLLGYIKESKVWNKLEAVRKNRILVTPSKPFNWIGRPPGINRLLGIKWLASSLYPDVANLDIEQETEIFFNLFYHVSPQKMEIQTLLNNN